MKASFTCFFPYLGVAEKHLPVAPPVAPGLFEADTARRSLQLGFELAELADTLGYDWVTLSEHHYSPRQLTSNPMLYATALAPRLKQAQLAILGATVPLLNPVRIAEEFAILDLMTNGRAILGLLRGTAPEYLTYGTNPGESRGRWEEGVELILRAFDEPHPFGWQGRYFQFRTVAIWPRPIQERPPMYLSANSPESGTFAARMQVGMGLSLNPLHTAARLAEHYRSEAARFGWQPTPEHVVYRGSVVVAETDAQAEEIERAFHVGQPGGGIPANTAVRDAIASTGVAGPNTSLLANPTDRYQQGATFRGSPDTVARQIRAFNDEAGVGVVDLLFGGPPHIMRRGIELFGAEVLPRIREF